MFKIKTGDDNMLMKKSIKQYIIIILAAILLAFDYQLFIVNNGFAPAGINGIATMIQYKTGFSIGYMSIIINVPLCIMAFFALIKALGYAPLFFVLFIHFLFRKILMRHLVILKK